MKTIVKTCEYCNSEFNASLKEHNRGNAKYCSRKCSGIAKQGKRESTVDNVECALCGKAFHLSTSKQTKSKSGLYFCCRKHKDEAQRIGGIEEIQPDHYGQEATSTYRKLALRTYENKCEVCGYDKYTQVLEVHHRDKNRKNNSIGNLQILCPTCHKELHFLDGSGCFTSSQPLG